MADKLMHLWEYPDAIDRAIAKGLDVETGEISQIAIDEMNQLIMDQNKKREGVALAWKSYKAFADQIDMEIGNLEARKKAIKRKADFLKSYLEQDLNGKIFETPKVKVLYKGSDAVVFDEGKTVFDIPTEWLKCEYSVRKTDAAKAIKAGQEIPGLHLEHRRNMSIK